MFPDMLIWQKLLLAGWIAMVLAFAATPLVKKFAEKVGAMDVPKDARRVHDHPIPRMGGLAIFIGFIVSILIFGDITRQVQGILIGCVIIVVTGILDDILNLRWWIKLGAQFLAAFVAVGHGVVIDVLSNPNIFSENAWLVMGYLSIPVTILWIVGITNAVNLIDGLDGLACGVSTISAITMLIVALMVSEPHVAVILAALVGACLGFIPYNLNPAKIFMGDTGALLLGYLLSTVSILGMFKFYAIMTFLVPILALALPLFDTLFAIIRRLLKGQNPMTPDRGHLHHRLIDHGLSQKQAVAVLYAFSALLGLTAVVLCVDGEMRMLMLGLDLLVAVAVGLFALRTIEHPANQPHHEEAPSNPADVPAEENKEE